MKLKKLRKNHDSKQKPLVHVWNDPALDVKDGVLIEHSMVDVITQIQQTFSGQDDLEYHRVQIQGTEILVVWLNSLVQPSAVNEYIFIPFFELPKGSPANILEQIENLSGTSYRMLPDVIKEILQGSVAMIFNGTAYICKIGTAPGRAVDRAYLEPSLFGPQDAFVESLDTNISQIRKRLCSLRLKVRQFSIGNVSQSTVSVIYLDGIAKPENVAEMMKRLEEIQIDAILDVNYIDEWICDGKYSPFPTIQKTERPDRATGALLEGRIVILANGSPLALILPAVYVHFLQASEDYYEKYIFAFPIRILRHVYYWVSLLLPSIYVALLSFHQEMIPTLLLKSFITSREGIPFPVIVEAIIMEVTFEVLREAGLRLPKTVGQSVSIVGALVIGEAAVQAGIVSPVMVIIVSVTGIASFSIPNYSLGLTNRVLRFPIMILAAFFGLYGVVMAVLVILTHMASLKSLGKPYMSPFAPFNGSEMKDTFLRAPWWVLIGKKTERTSKSLNPSNAEQT